MAAAIRLAVSLAVVLLAHGTAGAQLPVAPAPHPALDELVKEYKRLGLPVPPPEAEPVRVKWGSDHKPYFLAFRCPPTRLGEGTRYLEGTTWWPSELRQARIAPEMVTPVGPSSEALRGVRAWDNDLLAFAVQCEIRGWNELARVVYSAVRKELEEYAKQGKWSSDPLRVMRGTAWYYWETKLTEHKSDRKEIWTQLRYLAKADPTFLTEKNRYTLEDLEATLAPRKSKPGSIEALIDELTDLWDDPEDWENEAGQTAYWKLIELGFDAVPALMDHLKDNRLTRSMAGDIKGHRWVMRVNQAVESILNQFSGGRFDVEYRWEMPDRIVEPKNHKWLEMVRCGGEEAWLLDNVLPKEEEDEPHPNTITLRVIRAKYPHRLKDVYQAALLKHPHVYSEQVTKAIVASKLPVREKIAILERGIANEDSRHRHYALEALAEVDAAAFKKHLIRMFETFRANSDDGELGIAGLIRKTDDPRCWNELLAACQRVSLETRLYFIRVTGWPPYPGEPDPGRREALRFLLRFLNADVISEDARDCRDLATFQLAKQFALFDWKVDPQKPKPLESPREISLLRDRVRELAERELSRPAK